MNWAHAQMLVVDAAGLAVRFAANWLVQSSLLILAGLTIAWWVKRRGSAMQSVVYRTTLLAVVICPLATWGLSLAGVTGWSVDLPSGWSESVALPPGEQNLSEVPAAPLAESKPVTLREKEPPAAEPVTFSESDFQSPELLPPQTPPAGTVPADDFAQEVVAVEIDNSPVAIDTGDAEAFSPIVEPSASEEPRISTFGIAAVGLCSLWALVAAGLVIRLGWAWRRMVRLCRHGAEADASLMSVCRELAETFCVPPPKILYSPYVSSPCLAGLSRPTILLPEMESADSIRDVLIHELAHLQRRDCHWNLLRQLATAVFFFQPLLWKLGRRLEAAAEEVCDDYVVQLGGDRADYANQLLEMAERRLATLRTAGVGMLSLKSLLARRVIRVLDTSRSLSTRVGNLLLIVVIAGGLIGTTIAAFVGLGQKPSAANAGQDPAQESPAPGEPQASAKTDGEAPAAPKDQKPEADHRGRVVDEKGQPIPGAELYWIRSRVHELDHVPPKHIATTNAQGEFEFSAPAFAKTSPEEPAGWEYSDKLVVKAKGHGFAYTYPGKFQPPPAGKGFLEALANAAAKAGRSDIMLPAAGNPIRGKLVDIEGQPIAGATVRIRWFNGPDRETNWRIGEAKVRDEQNAERRARVNGLLSVIEPFPLRQALPSAKTNARGEFELRDIGRNRLFQLLIEGEGLQSTDLIVLNEPGEVIEIAQDRHQEGKTRKVFPQEFLQAIGPSKPIAGRVLDWETGKPIAGAVVRAFKVHGELISSSREREHFAARTDAEGRYRITGLPIGENNELVAFTTGELPYVPIAHRVNTSSPAEKAVSQDFRLRQGVWAEGRVFDKTSDKPFTGEISYYFFANPEWEGKVPGTRQAFLDGRYWTNSKGEYRLPVLPSRGILAFNYGGNSRDRDGIDRYPRGQGAEAIEGMVELGGGKSFPTRPHYLIPFNYERLAEVNPADGQKTIRVDMPLTASRPVVVKVAHEKDRAPSEYQVYGANERFSWERKTEDQFEITDLKPEEKRKVFVFDRERNLAGAIVVKEGEKEPMEVSLGPAGRLTGRLVDEDGEPITDASVFPVFEKMRKDDKTAIWASHPKLRANPTTIPVDEEGRFELHGLIPGWKYSAYVSAPRKFNGQLSNLVLGHAFENVEIAAGETKALGDVTPSFPKKKKSADGQDTTKTETASAVEIQGHITNDVGEPIAGANVTLIAEKRTAWQGGTGGADTAVLAQATTDQTGSYRLTFNGAASQTHREANLLVRKQGQALAWKDVNLEESRTEADFQLQAEELLRGKLIDVEGQPAADVQLVIQSVAKRRERQFLGPGVRYKGEAAKARAWIPPVTSDKDGRFTIPGMPKEHGVFLVVDGGDRFAPQTLAVSTGLPEQRGERDGTYRSQVKNAKPGEEVTLVLPPAQIFEGRVTYEDTGEPAPLARVSVWASQQRLGGSMVAVYGQADAQGRYRISAKPGVRFGVNAYPPPGVPYLARRMPHDEAIVWESGDRVKEVNMTLPRGVLIKGSIQAADSKTPITGATIQYTPESSNNPNVSDDILTGWQDLKVSKEDGTFETVVLPGPGRLLVQRPGGNFVFQEIGSRELVRGTPGGTRTYAHAIERVNPEPGAKPLEVRILLQPGETIKGRLVDEAGKPVDHVQAISRLNISPYSATWRGGGAPMARGGEFEIIGLEKGKEYPIHFLQSERRLGATVILKAGGPEPTVDLKPCGQARFRLVDAEGRSVADHAPTVEMVVTPGPHKFDSQSAQAGKLAGDSDFIQNVDRLNQGDHHISDKLGEIVVPALVPGATYQIVTRIDNKFQIAKRFEAKANETLDLGDILVERQP